MRVAAALRAYLNRDVVLGRPGCTTVEWPARVPVVTDVLVASPFASPDYAADYYARHSSGHATRVDDVLDDVTFTVYRLPARHRGRTVAGDWRARDGRLVLVAIILGPARSRREWPRFTIPVAPRHGYT